jgi:hypothetical protein
MLKPCTQTKVFIVIYRHRYCCPRRAADLGLRLGPSHHSHCRHLTVADLGIVMDADHPFAMDVVVGSVGGSCGCNIIYLPRPVHVGLHVDESLDTRVREGAPHTFHTKLLGCAIFRTMQARMARLTTISTHGFTCCHSNMSVHICRSGRPLPFCNPRHRQFQFQLNGALWIRRTTRCRRKERARH